MANVVYFLGTTVPCANDTDSGSYWQGGDPFAGMEDDDRGYSYDPYYADGHNEPYGPYDSESWKTQARDDDWFYLRYGWDILNEDEIWYGQVMDPDWYFNKTESDVWNDRLDEEYERSFYSYFEVETDPDYDKIPFGDIAHPADNLTYKIEQLELDNPELAAARSRALAQHEREQSRRERRRHQRVRHNERRVRIVTERIYRRGDGSYMPDYRFSDRTIKGMANDEPWQLYRGNKLTRPDRWARSERDEKFRRDLRFELKAALDDMK